MKNLKSSNIKTSVLNYLAHLPSCYTCLTYLVPYAPTCFTCSCDLRMCLHALLHLPPTCLTFLHFFTCLTCLHFFYVPYASSFFYVASFFTCVGAFIFLRALRAFTLLKVSNRTFVFFMKCEQPKTNHNKAE